MTNQLNSPSWFRNPSIYLWFFTLVLTCIALFPTLNNGWVNFDDETFVLNNPLVQTLSLKQVGLFFSTPEVLGNYHPLTLLSLAFDYQLFGDNAFGYHLTNLILHLINVSLIFAFVLAFSGRRGTALVTALLGGIHPMHIESIAWISARKDLLYAGFFIAGLIFYLKYLQADKEKQKYLWICLGCFLGSLLSKGMAITFPLVLLLLDHVKGRTDIKKMLTEKAVFWVLAVVFGIILIYTQQLGSPLSEGEQPSFLQAPFVALYGIGFYALKALIPYHLSAFHPYPESFPPSLPGSVYLYGLLVLGLLVLAWRFLRKDKNLVFGIGFYICALLPVLQLISFGNAMVAERYTYLAYIGLFYIVGSWIDNQFMQHSKASLLQKRAIGFALALFCLILMQVSQQRIAVWQDGESLWSDVIEKYPNDFFGYGCRGLYFVKNQQPNNAIHDFSQSIFLNPYFADNYVNRGRLYAEKGDWELAMADYNQASAIDSTNYLPFINRAAIFRKNKNYPRAIDELGQAIRLHPTGHTQDPKSLGLTYFMRSLCYNDLAQYGPALQDGLKAKSLQHPVSDSYLKELKSKMAP